MELTVLRSCVVGDYNTRNSTKVRLLDKFDFLSNFKIENESIITDAYISATETLIHSSFWALSEKNYTKCLAFFREYRKRISYIESRLSELSNSKNEITILEEKIKFDEVKSNTWTRMSQFMGFSTHSGYISLKNRINVYNNTVKKTGNIDHRINYLKALTKDIEYFWKSTKDKLNKVSISSPSNNDEYRVSPSMETPEINFSLKHKYFSIKGKANPTNYYAFWSPITHWVDKQFGSGFIDSTLTLEINVSYICPRSSSYLLRILKVFSIVGATVNWFHEHEDGLIEDINGFKHFLPSLNLNRIELDV